MNDSPVTLRIESGASGSRGALSAYLEADARKSKLRLPAPEATKAIEAFRASLSNLTARLSRFLSGSDKQVSHLVLGKVQSGKTAHLLGMLAWAADSPIDAGIVFTGITGSLNEQTQTRLVAELESLDGKPIKVLEVPTIASSKKFSEFIRDLLEAVSARRENGSLAPLPILVTMKNTARANAVARAISEVVAAGGPETAFLVVDDESDQASQNAKAKSRGVAATYAALASIRNVPARNIWLSYTATPQAVFLTEKFGRLRPDYIAVIPPRHGYFGLSDAMSPDFAKNLIEVSDWRVRASQLSSTPQSLTDSIWRFFFVAWARINFPSSFYSQALSAFDSDNRLKSTQMLIHESGKQADHSRMFSLVRDEWLRLKALARSFVDDSLGAADRKTYLKVFSDLASRLELSGAPALALLPEFNSVDGQSGFLKLLEDSKIIVVNSDGAGPTQVSDRPVEDSDYAAHPAWILIGGDILGRGITIPQLTVSYFLRSSQRPNFDTVLQQLRFCGYRGEYRDWMSIFAPMQSLTDLKYMEIVDRAVWERAATWDRNEIRLVAETMPRIFYASPTAARFEPTRTSVRDPDISDRKLTGDSIFSLREIFEPQDLRANLTLLQRWQGEERIVPQSVDGLWERFDDVSGRQMSRLLSSWSSETGEKRILEAASELYDPELLELGLTNVPNVIFVKKILRTIRNPLEILTMADQVDVTRRAGFAVPSSGANWNDWKHALAATQFLPPEARARLQVPHIGAGQRLLKSKINHDAVIVIIEPILGLVETRDRGSAIGIGLGLSALSPSEFEIRTIGHS